MPDEPPKPPRIALWEAINQYAMACHGRPDKHRSNIQRMAAVTTIERIVDVELTALTERVRQMTGENEALRYAYSCDLTVFAAVTAERDRLRDDNEYLRSILSDIAYDNCPVDRQQGCSECGDGCGWDASLKARHALDPKPGEEKP